MLCGLAGKSFSSLDVSQSKTGGDSQGSRRAQSAALQSSEISGNVGSFRSSYLATPMSQSSISSVAQQEAIALKAREVALQERDIAIQEHLLQANKDRSKREAMENYLKINTNLNCEKRRKVAQRYEEVLYDEIFGTQEVTSGLSGVLQGQARPYSASTPLVAAVVPISASDDFDFNLDEPDDVQDEESV